MTKSIFSTLYLWVLGVEPGSSKSPQPPEHCFRQPIKNTFFFFNSTVHLATVSFLTDTRDKEPQNKTRGRGESQAVLSIGFAPACTKA